MSLTGLLVGWRIREGFVDAVLAFLLLLVFAYAISWVMAYVGLLVPSVEVVNNAAFIVIFPLTFISNAFVPPETFPARCKTFAEWNPVSSVTQAAASCSATPARRAGAGRRGRCSTRCSTR